MRMRHRPSRRFVPPRPLPGEPRIEEEVARMMRVDHAGELAAVHIYRGQRVVMGERHRLSPVIREMETQEQEHLARFDRLLQERRVRPSLLAPLWEAAGYALGAVTALMGPHAAMAATAAVEEVIDDHYARQRDRLRQWPETAELAETVERFRRDEASHREEALAQGAERTPGYPLLAGIIKAGCRFAIRIAERI